MVSRTLLPALLVLALAAPPAAAPGDFDLLMVASAVYARPAALLTDPCTLCTSGPLLDLATLGQDPQAAAEPVGPGQYYFAAGPGSCTGAAGESITLAPVDGHWAAPMAVWRGHVQGLGPLVVGGGPNPSYPLAPGGSLEVVPANSTAPVVLGVDCSGGGFVSRDLLVLPFGFREDVAVVAATGAGSDADAFTGWS